MSGLGRTWGSGKDAVERPLGEADGKDISRGLVRSDGPRMEGRVMV